MKRLLVTAAALCLAAAPALAALPVGDGVLEATAGDGLGVRVKVERVES